MSSFRRTGVSECYLLLQVLLPAASLLQLMDVRQNCCDFLQSQLHPTNCLGIRAFADVHTCTDLLQQANAYAGKAGQPASPLHSWTWSPGLLRTFRGFETRFLLQSSSDLVRETKHR